MTTGAVPGHLRLGLHALSELSGRLLKGGKRHPAPLRQQAQMRISAERSFYNMNPQFLCTARRNLTLFLATSRGRLRAGRQG